MPVRKTESTARSRKATRAEVPRPGDYFRVDYADKNSYLEEPPRGTMWYQPGGEGATFKLAKLGEAPFRLADLIGINRHDKPPKVPDGKRLMRVGVHAAAKGNRSDAAHLYKVIADDSRDMVWTDSPRVGYQIGQLYSIAGGERMPDPPEGTEWEVMGRDAEMRGHVWALLRRSS